MTLTQLAILGRLTQALLDDGYRVIVSDQDGGGLFVYASPDNGDGNGPFDFWVRLETANDGADFISDYTTNLNAILEPVTALADVLETLNRGA